MTTATREVLATSSNGLNLFIAFVLGMIVVCALIGAVYWGMRVMERESARPRAEEQPKLPLGGAVREERESREPDEIPLNSDGSPRLMPYELRHSGSRRGASQARHRWLPGGSGSFGSGGAGHR
ncbi:DUF6479 family protein [Streptomyces sp. NPDC048182]|uniref:DUF6479 family protein n=1 Tax=unclassified Streptomyces TaxID=2593676 RepID=UPI0033A1EC95